MKKDAKLKGTIADAMFTDYTEVGSNFDKWMTDKEDSYEELCVKAEYQAPSHLARKVLENFPPYMRRVIDFACGSGLAGESFIKRGLIVDGIDVSVEMLKKAKERGYQKTVVSDITRIDTSSLAFMRLYDVALCVGCFGEYVNPCLVIPVMSKSLKKRALIGFSSESNHTDIVGVVRQLEEEKFGQIRVELNRAYHGGDKKRAVHYYYLTAKRY